MVKDFITTFAAHEFEQVTPNIELHNVGNPGNRWWFDSKKLIAERQSELDAGQIVYRLEHSPAQNVAYSSKFSHVACVKNRVFVGPFKIIGIHGRTSVDTFAVILHEEQDFKLVGNIKSYDMFDMMKNGFVNNNIVTCNLTFTRSGSSHFLERVK